MDWFNYRDGTLHAEDVAVSRIAEAVGTPFYVYSTATLTRHIGVFHDALEDLDHEICYALKANSNLAVLQTLAGLGVGADVVSGGELFRALRAGIPGEKIVFSGVGKTADEIRMALDAGIGQFNVESEPELLRLAALAEAAGRTARIAIRINPDVEAGTHAKISTGRFENKFGVPIHRAAEMYRTASAMRGVEPVGLAVHIGSQLTALAPFEAAFEKIADLARQLQAEGFSVTRLDLGGGLGIPYQKADRTPPLPFDYGALIKRTVGNLGARVIIEPGRLVVGNAGIVIASVIHHKAGEGRDFLIVDAAMNDLIRPAMYDAWHEIWPVVEPAPDAPVAPIDVVGPVCETGDTFARARDLPRMDEGDLLAFRGAGAYGAVMASEYNARPLIPEVLVNGEAFAVVRPRPTYEEMLARECLPPWLDSPARS
ncbi:MAG TPA: diaminopimelate decarboxylase [Thermohalobaculum sp.]|nr:diaminopimelate decarboxylase [Thermohalobaculum sp.]